MNSLERSLIEKAGYSHGWENVQESTPERVVLFSSRHKVSAHITPTSTTMVWKVHFPQGPSTAELLRSLPDQYQGGETFQVNSEASLGCLLRRAAELAISLPNQAVEHYAHEIAKFEANPPNTTEVWALVKQRRGQEIFRAALMDYWSGTCAVTGIAIPELLRASHAKPWAMCESDQERMNVYNGFLLCAHLDALFDKGLMTFNTSGEIAFAPSVEASTLVLLGLDSPMKLRWIAPQHQEFLAWHHQHVFKGSDG